jgi:CDP-diacylglycerol--glycerol-3-phosphate 3-phosphatidyltransferase
VLSLKNFALLLQDYFTNRQDRYVVVENCPKLADYFDQLTQHISEFSFKVVHTPDQVSIL